MANKTLIVDTRQQKGHHVEKHLKLEEMGYELDFTKLEYGDYALAPNRLAVDTKKDVDELVSNIGTTKEKVRFTKECIKAVEAGGALVVLVIDGTHQVRDLDHLHNWIETPHHFKCRLKARGKYKKLDRRKQRPLSRNTGGRFETACKTMEREYGVRFLFCSSEEECAVKIDELLADEQAYMDAAQEIYRSEESRASIQRFKEKWWEDALPKLDA